MLSIVVDIQTFARKFVNEWPSTSLLHCSVNFVVSPARVVDRRGATDKIFVLHSYKNTQIPLREMDLCNKCNLVPLPLLLLALLLYSYVAVIYLLVIEQLATCKRGASDLMAAKAAAAATTATRRLTRPRRCNERKARRVLVVGCWCCCCGKLRHLHSQATSFPFPHSLLTCLLAVFPLSGLPLQLITFLSGPCLSLTSRVRSFS